MEENLYIRSWYQSKQRLLEIVDMENFPEHYLYLLHGQLDGLEKSYLGNIFSKLALKFIRANNIQPFFKLATKNELKPGTFFTYSGHFYGKGFSASNKTPNVSLSEKIFEFCPKKKLLIEFSKTGLLNDTAWSRLSGSTNLFVFATITEINDDFIKAVPFIIGDLLLNEHSNIDFHLIDTLSLPVDRIDQFKNVDFTWRPTQNQFNKLKNIPEAKVKELLCNILGELEVPKDWGGEESDLFTSNLSVDNEKFTGAFLLKGPSKFHEMTLADCGKNGDQIYRLFNIPAEIFIIQHCHKISPAVRKTVKAFAMSQYSIKCKYTFIDGYDTVRILRSNGLL